MIPGGVTPRVYVYDVANFTDPPPSRELAFGKQLGGSLYSMTRRRPNTACITRLYY